MGRERIGTGTLANSIGADIQKIPRKGQSMIFRSFLLSVFCIVLSSEVWSQDTYVDYDHSLPFATYRTYAWGQQLNPNEIKSPFLAQEAKSQVV